METTYLTIRAAVLAEAGALAAIARRAYAPYVRLMGQEPAPMGADYAAHIANDTCFIAEMSGAEAGGKLAGFAVLMQKPDGWWLETIATDPAHQRGGAGAALMARCEQFLKPRTDRWFLYTNEVMAAPYAWYIRQGFGETHRATENGFARIFMMKRL